MIISVRHDFLRLKASLSEFQQKQLPFATALALTQCAKLVQRDMVDEMRRVFDRPIPFTLNSLRTEPATKRDLQANVHLRDFAPKGTPAGRYLSPQIEGGSRLQKRSERRLIAAGVMQPGSFIVPRSGAELDPYGNISRGQMVAVLSKLGALGDSNATKGKPGRGKRRKESYFAVQPGTNRNPNLKPGVYQRISSTQLKPIYGFVRSVSYTQRLDFFGFAERRYEAEMPRLMEEALVKALRTARR